MFDFQRYAIYFAPERGSNLARLGASWLGWDADSTEEPERLEIDGLPAPLEDITKTPRKYGMHGTLKPPFRLAKGADVGTLDRALIDFASLTPAFEIPRMHVASLGHFVAIVPLESPPELEKLASNCVESFDAFRAELSSAEMEKRRKNGLSERQDDLLKTWGYPYVMEEFRFHLTLTGPLDPDAAGTVRDIAQTTFKSTLAHPVRVRDICLFGEQEDGHFSIIRRYALSG